MAEKQESEAQDATIGNSVLPKSNPKPDVAQVIMRKNSPESRVEYEPPKEETFEKQPTNAQATGQMTAADSAGLSTGKRDDIGRTGDQTPTGGSTEFSIAKSAELRELELKEKQIAEQDQKIQELEQKDAALKEQKLKEFDEQLQEIKQKNEQQPQGSDSETDQDKEYYQGLGQ